MSVQSVNSGTEGVEVDGPPVERSQEVLTPAALGLVALLQRRFGARRDELLARRGTRRAEMAAAGGPDFLPETAAIRDDPSWKAAPAPSDLVDRRVEITGPTDPKMAINALNSGARVWLADLEDANTPHWRNVVTGQVVMFDVARRQLRFEQADGRVYALKDGPLAVPLVRPRGWHLDERHITVDGAPVVAAFADFGLHFANNARELVDRGSGPYYYLAKNESHLEARLWNDVFVAAQEYLGLPVGTVRATVLIETLPAAFEMEEILYELRDHVSGLNAGRWDYLFSTIKVMRDAGPAFVLPDRNAVTMTAAFLRAYTELLVSTCHRRGAFAIGGMSAFIPSRRDAEVNARAFEKVRADKTRESADGFDGSWVAHPDLVPICDEVFSGVLGDRQNQLDRVRADVLVTASDLLSVDKTPGSVTEPGLRSNVSVALIYLTAWLGGSGAVAIHNLMEDAATAEISRSQIWQWVHAGVQLDSGATVTRELVERVLAEESGKLQGTPGVDGELLEQAVGLFATVALADDFADFLTLPAYELID